MIFSPVLNRSGFCGGFLVEVGPPLQRLDWQIATGSLLQLVRQVRAAAWAAAVGLLESRLPSPTRLDTPFPTPTRVR